MHKLLLYSSASICSILLLGCHGDKSFKNKGQNTAKSISNKKQNFKNHEKLNNKLFFETEKIRIDTLNNKIIITIENSNLIKEQKQILGKRWVNSEAIVSTAAMNFADSINSSIDSIGFKILDEDKSEENYLFSTSQLKNANEYFHITEEFLTTLFSNRFSDASSYLSKDIRNSNDNKTLEAEFGKMFILTDKYDQIDLKGLKINNGKYSIYFNICYLNHGCQTYAFSFLENENKIGGIKVIK